MENQLWSLLASQASALPRSCSTIATILKNKNKVTEAVKGSASFKAMRLTKIREGPISDMDKLLMTWVEDQAKNRIPLNTMTIMNKVKFCLRCWKKMLERIRC